MNLLLKNLTDKETRTAQFKTVIALNLNGEQHLFTGIAKGEITLEKIGNQGLVTIPYSNLRDILKLLLNYH
jgi:XTP/dITP diphosphohydrolase